MKHKLFCLVAVVISFFAGVSGTIVIMHYYPNNSTVIEKKDVSVVETNTIKDSVEKIYDAVVLVSSYSNNKLIGSGTGFVYKKDDNYGYIITNHHVIENADTVYITNTGKESVEATILGSDEYADVASLSIKKDAALEVASIGDSTVLSIGDTLFTVGSPLGSNYMGTVTKGILSGKDRTVEVNLTNGSLMMEVIQTDAAINPGNSGGPLVNINGEVIGVNSMKLVEDEIEGMGFAIPIEMVMATVDRLEKGEIIDRPVLGISTIDVSDTYSLYRNRVYLDDEITYGVYVTNVEDGMPASLCGIKEGDIVLEFNGTKVKNMAHFRFMLYKYSMGDTIKLKIIRDSEDISIDLVLSKSVS